EFGPGEERIHRVALGHQPERAVDLRVTPAGRAADGEFPARRREEPGDHVQHGGLARAVRAEQAGDPGPDGHRDVVDRHHVAVPAGDVAQLDRAHAAPTFRYLAARPPRLTASNSTNIRPYATPALPGSGMGPGLVPPSHCRTPSRTVNGLIRPGRRAPSGTFDVTSPGPGPCWAMLTRIPASIQVREK